MSMSLSLLVSDRKLLPCVCHVLNRDLESLQRECLSLAGSENEEAARAQRGHLGIGYYLQSEVLLSRRPLYADSSFSDLVCRAGSSCLLGHVTVREDSGFKPIEAQPHRYRDWLWAQSGRLREAPGFDRRQLAMPSYIAANLRTWQPAEVIFHLFLSFLHRTGPLSAQTWDRAATRKALASALSYVANRYVGPQGEEQPSFSIMATNGEVLFAHGHDRSIYYRQFEGIESCALCTDRRDFGSSERPPVRHPHLKAVVVSDILPRQRSEGPGTWEEVPAGHVLEVDAGLGVEHGPLKG